MSCENCHTCCEFLTLAISNIPKEEKEFLITWGVTVVEEKESVKLMIHSPCQHLKDGCDIYEIRPQQCRDYFCERSKKV